MKAQKIPAKKHENQTRLLVLHHMFDCSYFCCNFCLFLIKSTANECIIQHYLNEEDFAN